MLLVLFVSPLHAAPRVVGDGSPAWQPMRIDFRGETFSESDGRVDPEADLRRPATNPFLDRRLQVRFEGPSGRVYDVPGYFDGDGEGGAKGDVWRARFTPDGAGRWSYTATLRAGRNVAVSLEDAAGEPVMSGDFDERGSVSGTFDVGERDADAPGFLGRGRLVYVGPDKGAASHYLHTAGDGKVWIKTGTDSPENWLGYAGFDGARSGRGRLHDFAAHRNDWRAGDPNWQATGVEWPVGDAAGRAEAAPLPEGKNIIGAINYLADRGVNSIYFLPMNIGGDGQDSFPYLDRGPDNPREGRLDLGGNPTNDNTHFDLGRLAQWEMLFDHCQRRGVTLHIVLNEAEEKNKRELDDATLGPERKLFYREMAARFGHHNAIIWNMSEEYDFQLKLPPERIREWAAYLDAVDAYDHPTTVHNQGSLKNPERSPWTPFLGDEHFDLTSFQAASKVDGWGEWVQAYRTASAKAGRPIPIMVDEAGSIDRDAKTADDVRRRMLYPMLFSGAGGVEWFTEGMDQSLDNFRPFTAIYEQSAHARRLIQETTGDRGVPHDELVRGAKGAQVLAVPGEVYLIYLPDASAGGVELDLREQEGARYSVEPFDPRAGTSPAPVVARVLIDGGTWVGLPAVAAAEDRAEGRDRVLVVRRR